MSEQFHEAHPPLYLTADDGEAVELSHERLPKLLGWTVLLQPWSPPAKTKGGIFLPDQVQDANEHLAYVFRVVALGPLAFKHPRLRGGPRSGTRRIENENGHETWFEVEETEFAPGVEPPKPGDWVIVRKFSGIRLELEGVSMRLCNDDDLLAKIDSPKGWRAYV